MLFNSYPFLFLFLPLTLLGYYLIKHKRSQLWFLFLTSVFFYCYWSTVYVFLLLFTVVLDFYVAKYIFTASTQRQRKLLLVLSMGCNLSILAFFKYYNFFADSVNGLSHLAGVPEIPTLNLILPIGISFYTFQSMSYVIDVYRRTSTAHPHLLEFAGYVTLFPHQISGPLVRHNQIVPQLEDSKTYFFHSENFWRGCYFFIFGLAKKMLIADRLSAVVDPLVLGMHSISNVEAWLAMFGYTMQLYFDFSGYSDMAVGLGLMMNISFPKNFNSPYKARSITEFWQRWHITLSSWLRDYLYISLGGNRRSSLITYRNLIITMVLGGLWHGANWTFIVWGSLHGGVLAIERFFKNRNMNLIPRFLHGPATFMVVCIGWIFFRSHSVADAKLWISKILFLNPELSWDLVHIPLKHKDRFFVVLIISFFAAFFTKNTWEKSFPPTVKRAILLAFLFVLCLTFMNEESPFLYFQF